MKLAALVVLVHGDADDAMAVVVDAARPRVMGTIPFDDRTSASRRSISTRSPPRTNGSDDSFRYGVDVPAQQSLVVQGPYAYVCRGRGLMRVLDARTGSLLRRYKRATLPICAPLLYGQSSAGTSSLAPV